MTRQAVGMGSDWHAGCHGNGLALHKAVPPDWAGKPSLVAVLPSRLQTGGWDDSERRGHKWTPPRRAVGPRRRAGVGDA